MQKHGLSLDGGLGITIEPLRVIRIRLVPHMPCNRNRTGFSILSTITGLRIIDGATKSAGAKIRWVQHDSSLERGRLAELLVNLSRQTSLEFRRQDRPVDIWSVIEE
jgi:hypothetical protein